MPDNEVSKKKERQTLDRKGGQTINKEWEREMSLVCRPFLNIVTSVHFFAKTPLVCRLRLSDAISH